jgi:ATP/maltotriose-dependent transcriptional regulator MalT
MWSGVTRLWRGDLVEAEALLRAGVEDFALWGHLRGRDVFVASFLARTLIERGDPAAARDVLEAVERPHGRRDLTRVWLAATADLLLAEGRAQEALDVGDKLDRDFGFMANAAWATWRPVKARALDLLGRRDEAAALLVEELELARRWGARSAIGRMLRLLGTVERGDGLEHLHEAATVLAGSTARLEEAKALAALGQTLRRVRRPTEAREPLRRALELAERCGAQALAETARSELYATGARPRRSALSGVDSLTTSERRVADLAAAGQTNRDIAQTLYVTPKTVEVHLGNAYRKLGIRSRRELAGALGSKIGVDV